MYGHNDLHLQYSSVYHGLFCHTYNSCVHLQRFSLVRLWYNQFDEFFYELLIKYKNNEHRVMIIFSEIAYFSFNSKQLLEFETFLRTKNLNPIYSTSFQHTIPALITLKLQQLIGKYLEEINKGEWKNKELENWILNKNKFFSLTQRQYETKTNKTDQCPKDYFNESFEKALKHILLQN